jgi:hypothetical protein
MSKSVPSSVYAWSQIVLEAVQDLREKKISVNEVKAVIAGINSVQAGLALRQEQARLSGARVNGDVIMDLKNDPDAQPTPRSQVLEHKPQHQQKKLPAAKTRKKAA